MAISKDAIFSILSMDAYNRGAGAAITFTNDDIGNATQTTDSDSEIRDAVNANDQSGAQRAGFFAVQAVQYVHGRDGEVQSV